MRQLFSIVLTLLLPISQGIGGKGGIGGKAGVGAGPPLTYVGQVIAFSATDSNTSEVVTVTNGVAAGDLIVIAWGEGTRTNPLTGVTSGCGGADTWTLSALEDSGSQLPYATGVATSRCLNGLTAGVGTITLAYGSAFSYKTAHILEFSGEATPPVIDTSNHGTSFGATVTTSITTTAAKNILVAVVCVQGQTYTKDAAWSAPATACLTIGADPICTVYKIVSSSGSYSPGGSFPNASWVSSMVAVH